MEKDTPCTHYTSESWTNYIHIMLSTLQKNNIGDKKGHYIIKRLILQECITIYVRTKQQSFKYMSPKPRELKEEINKSTILSSAVDRTRHKTIKNYIIEPNNTINQPNLNNI